MSYHSPISNRNPEPNNKQLFMLLGIFGGFFVLIIITFFILINQIINSIPVSLEHKLGALIIPSYEEKSDHSSQEKQLNQILDKLENLLPEKSKKDRDYQVLYIREDVVNAMAIPGDTIIIYEGLLKKIESENELVMILGHELGHFQNRDHLHRLGNMLLVKILLSYFLGDLETLSSGVDVINVIVNSQYSQKQESKADEIGLNLLNQYYGHVNGATDFFKRLNAEKKQEMNVEFLSSHPLPKKRIKRLNKLIKNKGYLLEEKKNCEVCRNSS